MPETAQNSQPISEPPAASNWTVIRFLVGNQKRYLAGLVLTAVLAGMTEAAILATIAQVAAALISDPSEIAIDIGPISLDMSVGSLLAVACGLVLARICLQGLSASLGGRLASDVQARLRTRLFVAYS